MQPINVAFDRYNEAGERVSSSTLVHLLPISIDGQIQRIPLGGRLEIYSIGEEDTRFKPIDRADYFNKQRLRELAKLLSSRNMEWWSRCEEAKRTLAELEKMEAEGKI